METPGHRLAALYPGAAAGALRGGLHGLLWDPVTSMPAAARENLRERIVPVAVAAFDGTSTEFWAERWADDALDGLSVLHVAVDATGAIAGWVSGTRADWGGRRVLYAASAGVAPDIQGGGISGALWRRVVERELKRSPLRALYVVARTGNPLVYDAWAAAAGGRRAVHPRHGTTVPERVRAIARDAAAHLGQSADLDPARLHVHDAYRTVPGGLWRDRPRSRDERTNAWFDSALQPADAFLIVVRFHPLAQIWRSVRRRLSGGKGR